MFGAATRRLAAWLAETCPQATVALEPPGETAADATVYAFLLEVRPGRTRSDRRNVVLEALLRYGVAADAGSPEQAHDLLGAVYAAAAAEAEIRVVAEPLAPEAWLAQAAPARPCLQVEVPVRAERTIEHRWTVEQPLQVTVVDRDRGADGTSPAAGRAAPDASDGEVDQARR